MEGDYVRGRGAGDDKGICSGAMAPAPCPRGSSRPGADRSSAWRAAVCALLVLPACLLDRQGTGGPAAGGAPPSSSTSASSTTGQGGAGGAPATSTQSAGGGGGDACGPGAPDADGDGVADACDACPGENDTKDADGDSTPDGCDPCPLDGPNANVPNAVTAHPEITISDATLGGGPGNVALVAPGSSVPIAFHWEIEDCTCPNCIDQIEVGAVPGGPLFCAYDGNPPCGSSAQGNYAGSFFAPAQPGVYMVRIGLGQDYYCDLGTTWWQGVPGDDRTLGAICVVAR